MSRKKHITRSFSIVPEREDMQRGLQVFGVLKKGPALTIADIEERTGISGDFLEKYVAACEAKGLVKVSGEGKDKTITFDGRDKKVLGVAFSGKECVLTGMDLEGETLTREYIEIDLLSDMKGKNKELEEIASIISDKTELSESGFSYMGLALPLEMSRLNEKSYEILGDRLGRHFKCDTLLAQDATAAGYGEKKFGAQGDKNNILYVHTDIGMGTVIKDEMIFESVGESGDNNSKYLRPWEQYGIISTAKNLVNKGLGSDMVGMVNGDIEGITLDVVFKAAASNDELAEDIVRMSGLALGVRVAYLSNIFDTDTVILGGGTEKSEGRFIDHVKESAKRFLLKDKLDSLEIVSGVMGKEASSVGAASLCRRELFMEALEV